MILPSYDTHLDFMFPDLECQAQQRRDLSDPMLSSKIRSADPIRCIGLVPTNNFLVRFRFKNGDLNLLFWEFAAVAENVTSRS
jgi:hypothetical protein